MIVGLMQNEKILLKLSQKWKIVPFKDVLKDSSGGNIKIMSKDTLNVGKIPIIDQGKDFVVGYTNLEDAIVKAKIPLILFGDHTRNLKYVDFNFAMGADGTKVLEIINEEAFPKFIYYYLSSINIVNTGYNRHFKFIKDLVFPLPPLATQKHIAQILDDAAALRDKTAQLIKEYDALAQSIFLDMFGDPVKNEKGWEKVNGQKVFKLIGGSAFKSSDYEKDGIPLIRIGTVNKGYFDKTQLVFLPISYTKKYERYIVYPKDLLITLTGTVGKDDYGNAFVLENDYNRYFLNQRVAKIELDKNYDYTFIKFFLKHKRVKSELIGVSRGVRQANISNEDFYKLEVIKPSITLQNQFAEKIALIEQQKELAKQELRESEDLFNCLLQKAFKGELA